MWEEGEERVERDVGGRRGKSREGKGRKRGTWYRGWYLKLYCNGKRKCREWKEGGR